MSSHLLQVFSVIINLDVQNSILYSRNQSRDDVSNNQSSEHSRNQSRDDVSYNQSSELLLVLFQSKNAYQYTFLWLVLLMWGCNGINASAVNNHLTKFEGKNVLKACF